MIEVGVPHPLVERRMEAYVPDNREGTWPEFPLPLHKLTHYPQMPSLRAASDRPDPLDTALVKPVHVDPGKIDLQTQLGINPGGRYGNDSGQEYYVKTSKHEHVLSELMNERIANQADYPIGVWRCIRTARSALPAGGSRA